MIFATGNTTLRGAETNNIQFVQQILRENAAMRSQLQQQQTIIVALTNEMAEIRRSNVERDRSLDRIAQNVRDTDVAPALNKEGGFGNVRISGEGGVGFFETGSQGAFPHAEFRVDEAKLFIDAAVWKDVYAFAEINLAERETSDVYPQLGEAYVDFENISQLWKRDGQLNIRVGRVDIPFGEEYLQRDAIDNPLISHSLADFWGVDEGIKAYGAIDKFSYVAAVLNGGVPDTADFHADKSFAGRLSYDPCSRWHFSASAMRTGELDVKKDVLSATWFGNGWLRSLGSPATTQFHADMVEGDITFRLPHGHISAFGGCVFYGDNDPVGNNHRDVYYYSIEAVHDVTRKFYAGAKFSQIFARNGFPIVGNGAMGHYLFGPLTDDIWRLSLGVGYRWNRHLVLKTEYTLERGKETGGGKRDHEDMFAAEAAFGF
jgi:hypothetical protein